MRPFAYHRATSVADALAACGRDAFPHPAVLAGGTTLLDLVKLDVMQPDRLVDLNRLPLGEIRSLPDGRLHVGALVRNSELAWHEGVRTDYPVLSAAILAGASGQIRNMATTAGNLMQRTRCPYFRDAISPCNKRAPGTGCAAWDGINRLHAVLGGSESCIATHPSDMCVALAVLEPEIVVRGAAGERSIAFRDFHLAPGHSPDREHALAADEIITALILPPPLADTRQRYVKLRDRASFEFALASAAVVLRIDRGKILLARVALGGVATTPWRAKEAEAVLTAATPSRETFLASAIAALRPAAPREHNRFKVKLAQQAIVRALEEAAS